MKDSSLLNELEIKVKLLVDNLKKEREKNVLSENLVHESDKLSKIEEKVKNLITIINQIDI